jgi:hypothetical protein
VNPGAPLRITSPHRVREGLVRSVAATPAGKAITTALYLPGDVVFPADPSGAQLYGTSNAALAPAIGDVLHTEAWGYQLERQGHLHVLRTLELAERIPAYLEHLREYGALQPARGGWAYLGTHEQLALDLAASREHVSKTLVTLAHRIVTGYRMLILVDHRTRKAAA